LILSALLSCLCWSPYQPRRTSIKLVWPLDRICDRSSLRLLRPCILLDPLWAKTALAIAGTRPLANQRVPHPPNAFCHFLFRITERDPQKALCFVAKCTSRHRDNTVLKCLFRRLKIIADIA